MNDDIGLGVKLKNTRVHNPELFGERPWHLAINSDVETKTCSHVARIRRETFVLSFWTKRQKLSIAVDILAKYARTRSPIPPFSGIVCVVQIDAEIVVRP